LPELILASARELFLDQGFANTSLQQIAARAGVTKRTLYVKVGDKEALFGAVVADMLRDWRESVVVAGGTGTLRSRLEQIGHQLLSVLLAPDMVRLHRVLSAEIYRFPALIQLMMQQSEDGPIPQLARLLMAERGASGVPSRHDMVAARLLHEMISSTPLRMAVFGRGPSIQITREEWVQEAVDMFLRGWPQATATPEGART
jgi:AcrR family transcriptional regulator